jgi:cell pole-organizing protein PopZ
MSAVNAPAKSSSLDEERRAHEPSMEEILASIRKIIADDDGLPVSRRERLDRLRDPGEGREPPAPAATAAYPGPALERRDAAQETPPRRDWFTPPPETVDSEAASEEPAPIDEADEALASFDDAEEAGDEERVDDADWGADGLDDGTAPATAVAPPSEEAPALVSQDAAASIASHFQALAASMVINDSGLLHDYAKEMLRPMLKQWLDDNLPVIVERLVRAEIERVARGRR